MQNKKYKHLLTNIEFVGYGHPDRFADYLAERIFNYFYKIDPKIRTAVEIMVTRNKIFLGGEIGKTLTEKDKDYIENGIVYKSIKEVYGEKWWPNYYNVKVVNNIKGQSRELSKIVNKNDEYITGDQGVSYGFWYYPRMILIDDVYKILNKIVKDFDLSPDYKALLSDGKLLISFCGLKFEYKKHIEHSIKNSLKKWNIDVDINKLDWNVGGPLADTGMVGRKLMVESFGTGIRHGGGCQSGKDFSKVDKSGILIATRIAKYVTDNFNFKKPVLVELDYFINNKNIPCTIKVGDKIWRKGNINFSDEVKKIINWLPYNTAELSRNGLIQTFLDNPEKEENE